MQHIPVRTFHPRRGRMGPRQHDVLSRLGPTLVTTVPDGPGPALDLARLFGRSAPVVLEIGSGMGESTVAQATADPDRDWLAVEVHTPGIASLLSQVDAAGLDNVRVVRGDALELLRHRLGPGQPDRHPRVLPGPLAQGPPPQAADHRPGAHRPARQPAASPAACCTAPPTGPSTRRPCWPPCEPNRCW